MCTLAIYLHMHVCTCICVYVCVGVEFESIHTCKRTLAHTTTYTVHLHVCPTPNSKTPLLQLALAVHCLSIPLISVQHIRSITRRLRINDMQSPFSKCAGPGRAAVVSRIFSRIDEAETVTALLARFQSSYGPCWAATSLSRFSTWTGLKPWS